MACNIIKLVSYALTCIRRILPLEVCTSAVNGWYLHIDACGLVEQMLMDYYLAKIQADFYEVVW